MKKRNLIAITFLLVLTLVLTSCSLFTNKKANEEGPEDSAETPVKEEQNSENTEEKDNEDINNSSDKETEDNNNEVIEKDDKEKESSLNEDSKNNEEASESNSNTMVLKVDDVINLQSDEKVYATAYDAKNSSNPVRTYEKGQYFVFKIYDDMINITKSKGVPGGWINPRNFGLEIQTPDSTNQNEQEGLDKSDSISELSEEKYSWSFAYPGEAQLALDKVSGLSKMNTDAIYLTFDNGYEYQALTGIILDSLKANNVKAVFFLTSDYMRNNLEFTKRIHNEGHIIGNHTARHLNHNEVNANQIKADISDWEKDYKNIFGTSPSIKLFRPPSGNFNETSLKIAQDLGYKSVLWTYAYKDWDTQLQPEEQSSLEKLLANNRAGNILLLHSVSKTNANIIDSYIKETRAQGFDFGLIQ